MCGLWNYWRTVLVLWGGTVWHYCSNETVDALELAAPPCELVPQRCELIDVPTNATGLLFTKTVEVQGPTKTDGGKHPCPVVAGTPACVIGIPPAKVLGDPSAA